MSIHIDAFDQYVEVDSVIHRLDSRVKVLFTVAYILSNALLPDGSWLAFGASWFLVLLMNDLSHLGLGFSIKRSVIVLPFILVAITVIFSPIGQPVAVWDLGFIKLEPTDYGILRFFSIMIRAWLSIQMAIILVSTTLFPNLIHALEHLRIPRILTSIIAFLYRYIFVLANEASRLLRARESRSAGLPRQKSGGNLLWRIKIVGSMAGQLFLRSYERSDRIYNAMVSRGYAGHIRTLKKHAMTRHDWYHLSIGLLFIVIIQLLGWIR
jgi:cobalt/nickel transport system permease protein